MSVSPKPGPGAVLNTFNSLNEHTKSLWLFNEGAGATTINNLYVAGTPLTIRNSPDWETDDLGDSAIHFAGFTSNQDARAASGAPDIVNKAFSVTARFKVVEVGGNSGIVSAGNEGNTDKFFHLRAVNATTLRFGLYNDDLDVTVPSNMTLAYHTVTVVMTAPELPPGRQTDFLAGCPLGKFPTVMAGLSSRPSRKSHSSWSMTWLCLLMKLPIYTPTCIRSWRPKVLTNPACTILTRFISKIATVSRT